MSFLRKIRDGAGACLRVLPFAALLALGRPAGALDPTKAVTQYVQTSWTSDSGLPENSVHAIAQTADGYMWIGTEEGLARFDGSRFIVFTSRNTRGLPSNYVQVLTADRDGSLWIGTDSGLSHFVPSPDRSRTGASNSFIRIPGLAGTVVRALCQDRNGALWVGTDHGLKRLLDGHLESWGTRDGLPAAAVRALVVDAVGTLWVGTDKGLSRFSNGRFVTLTTRDGLPGNVIDALAAAPDGSIFAGTLSHGMARIHNGRVALPAQHLPWNDIAALLPDRDGALWIAFNDHGMGRLYHGHLDLYGASRGLPSDRCSSILFRDREGSLWLGLQDAGIVQLRDGKFTVFGKPEGLSGNYIGNVLEARDGSIWIGADNNGLNHLLPDGRVELWNQSRGLPAEAVYSLLETHDGSIWVGYRRGALARIRNGHVEIYRDKRAADGALNALFEDRDGNLWVGTYSTGLDRFDHGRFLHVSDSAQIGAFAQSPDGALWIALNGEGVERISRGATSLFNTSNGLASNHALSLYADPLGDVWVGTAGGGLSRIHDGHIVTWTPDQGIPDSNIGSILPDNRGHLWFGSDRGIYSLSIDDLNRAAAGPYPLHPVLYGLADGLRTRETLYGSMPCAWRARDGRLWFATINGAAVIDPARVPVNTIPPPVWIEKITFDSGRIPQQSGTRLGPGSGNLEFSFSAPSFVAPQEVRFRYRLMGFDPDWIYTDSRHSARYTNISPGQYTFLVQAANSDGIWNQTGASFSFVLRRRLASTPAAWCAYIFLALLLVWGITARRTRTLLRRQQELTRIVAERTAQLEEEKSALEAARHELQIRATHDSLTGLFNRAAIFEHLDREISRSVRERTPLAIAIADLDHFKMLNDTYGHLCGDDIIREAAARIRLAMRAYDLAGRYGGEEFLILLPGLDPARTPERIDQLLQAIRSRPYQIAGGEITLTCSMGVATFHPDADPADMRALLTRADRKLYEAKNAGRNRASIEVCTLQ